MKKVVLIISLIIVFLGKAQVHTVQSTSFSYKVKSVNGWGESGENWTAKKETSVNITFDLKNDFIYVDSKEPQSYQLQSLIMQKQNKKGNKTITFSAIDNKSKPCNILIIYSKGEESHQI